MKQIIPTSKYTKKPMKMIKEYDRYVIYEDDYGFKECFMKSDLVKYTEQEIHERYLQNLSRSIKLEKNNIDDKTRGLNAIKEIMR